MKIQIFDQTYNVNADGNEEYLTELAAYVDKKMRAVSESTQMVDSVKVAVLAALNIADETFTLRQRTTRSWKARFASAWKSAYRWSKKHSSRPTDADTVCPPLSAHSRHNPLDTKAISYMMAGADVLGCGRY